MGLLLPQLMYVALSMIKLSNSELKVCTS